MEEENAHTHERRRVQRVCKGTTFPDEALPTDKEGECCSDASGKGDFLKEKNPTGALKEGHFKSRTFDKSLSIAVLPPLPLSAVCLLPLPSTLSLGVKSSATPLD